MRNFELIVVGGGSAGLAAAIEARKQGIEDILVLEKESELGGILNQCIHNGFGLHSLKKEYSGPAYAQVYIDEFNQLKIPAYLNTTVIELSADHQVTFMSPEWGVETIQAKAIILAMGCRERTRGAVSIPGNRCTGVWTAGTAQKYLNIEGYLVGKRIFILGSGDIGLIMARRLTLAGAEVVGVAELMPYSNGLTRNLVQCLYDYDIPLYLSTTITAIHGKERVDRITLTQVDETRQPIPSTSREIEVDTVLLSIGLIPENTLSTQAGIELDQRTKGAVVDQHYATQHEGYFACGNVLHVHDLVDYVSQEGQAAGRSAADYIKHGNGEGRNLSTQAGDNVSYVVPQKLILSATPELIQIKFRVKSVMKEAEVILRDQQGILQKIAKSHLAPAEMEMMYLSPKLLQQAQGSIIVEVREKHE